MERYLEIDDLLRTPEITPNRQQSTFYFNGGLIPQAFILSFLGNGSCFSRAPCMSGIFEHISLLLERIMLKHQEKHPIPW